MKKILFITISGVILSMAFTQAANAQSKGNCLQLMQPSLVGDFTNPGNMTISAVGLQQRANPTIVHSIIAIYYQGWIVRRSEATERVARGIFIPTLGWTAQPETTLRDYTATITLKSVCGNLVTKPFSYHKAD